jgi:hypothetical protein
VIAPTSCHFIDRAIISTSSVEPHCKDAAESRRAVTINNDAAYVEMHELLVDGDGAEGRTRVGMDGQNVGTPPALSSGREKPV